MSKLKFRVFILLVIFVLPIFSNAQIRNVSTNGTLIKGSYEETILNLVNKARREAGVSELKLDTTLSNAARQRAVELGSYYNANHLRPTLNRFSEIYGEFGINFNSSGENIAYGYGISNYTTPDGVFNVWFNSTPHRNNILSDKYNSLGIGIFKAPNGYYYWVQDFSDTSYKEYNPTNSYIEDYGNYTLKYEDTIYPNVTFSDISDVSMNVSDTKNIEYYITGKNTGSNADVRFKLLDWNSSNSNVVSITRSGDVVSMNANKAGSAKVSTTYLDREISFNVNVIGNEFNSYILYKVNHDSLEERIDISDSQELSTLFLEVEEISRNVVTQFYDNGDIVNESNIDIKFCEDDTCIKPIRYESNDELVADYIQDEFIFNNSGQTTITAIFENGLKVSIPVQVSLFRFDHNEYKANTQETFNTSIITDLSGNFSYKSLNPDIVSIDSNGVVSTLGEGIAIIECVNENGFTTYAKVDVSNEDEISIDIDEYNIELVEGGMSILKYSVIPHNAKVSFKSSDNSIVTVMEDGTILGLKSGIATIYVTVTTDKGSITKEVIVRVSKVDIDVTDIIVDNDNYNLFVGESILLNAYVVPNNANDKSLTYKSSDEMVAVVDGNGKISAINCGDAVITVMAHNGASKSIAVSVKDKDLEGPILEVLKTDIVLSIGMSHTLNIRVVPDRDVNVYSDDPSVASVDGNIITAIGNGTTTIHVTTELGDEVLVNVQVNDSKPITNIVLDKNDITLVEGESIKINANIEPSDTTDSLDLGWMSNNNDVATVDESGMITAISQGSTTIIVSSVNGVQSQITVNVTKRRIPISDIVVDKDDVELFIGDSIKINTSIIPNDTTDEIVLNWKSSDTGIATVDNDGNITAIHEGLVIITVSTIDGISHDIKVLVKENSIPITDILVDYEKLELEEGEFTSINAQVAPDNTTLSKDLAWESSDMNVVYVSQDGKIEAINSGNAYITITSVNGISKTIEVVVKKKEIPITSIKFDKDKIVLMNGQNYQINATIYPLNTTDSKILSWSSSNSDVLNVDDNGYVTTYKSGRSIVSATSINGITAQIIIDVLDENIKEIHLNKHDIVLDNNETILEIESFVEEDAYLDYDLIDWSSSNTNVVVIYNNRIIPVGYGEAFITARYGDISDTCRIVVPEDYTNILIGQLYNDIKKYENNENVNVLVGTNESLGITLNPDIQTLIDLHDNFRISWESSDNSILDVSDGYVRFLKNGKASIIVRMGMYSTTLNYNVYDIKTNISSNTIYVGDVINISTDVYTPDLNIMNYHYSYDNDIISIDNGKVTGLKSGIVTIYVYLENDLYRTINLEVKDKEIIKDKFNVIFDQEVVELENGKVSLKLEDRTNNISDNLLGLLSDNEELLYYFNISYVKEDSSFDNAIYDIEIPFVYDTDKYSSIYLLDEDGEIIDSIYEDGYIKFESKKLGNYMITGILKNNDFVDTDNDILENPNTGNNITYYVVSWIIAFLALGLLVITSVTKKRMN